MNSSSLYKTRKQRKKPVAKGLQIQHSSIKSIHSYSQYLLNTETVAVLGKNTNIVPVTIVK